MRYYGFIKPYFIMQKEIGNMDMILFEFDYENLNIINAYNYSKNENVDGEKIIENIKEKIKISNREKLRNRKLEYYKMNNDNIKDCLVNDCKNFSGQYSKETTFFLFKDKKLAFHLLLESHRKFNSFTAENMCYISEVVKKEHLELMQKNNEIISKNQIPLDDFVQYIL
jgi:hypothetical protein